MVIVMNGKQGLKESNYGSLIKSIIAKAKKLEQAAANSKYDKKWGKLEDQLLEQCDENLGQVMKKIGVN
jgi:hypothetical protein